MLYENTIHAFGSYIGVPVPERSDDEDLEQLVNLSQQGEVRMYFKRLCVYCMMTISLNIIFRQVPQDLSYSQKLRNAVWVSEMLMLK